jgi:hypothetical protein
MDDGRPRITRAGGINQDAHGDPAGDGASERGGELFAGFVVVENIGRERDGFLGRFDGGEHGGKRLVAIHQRLNLIVGCQWLRNNAADDAREHFQMFRACMFRFVEVLGDGAARRFFQAQRNGAAADAVDAEHEVKYRTKYRHQPDDADPKRRGAGITFVQQGVH